MLRVVIDTNVVVSALLTSHGNAARILNMIADKKLQICYSLEVLTEYAEVLARPRFGFAAKDREHFMNGVRRFGILTAPISSDIPFADPTDRIFYDVAKSCDALLVTGNTRHFPSEPFISSPAVFLKLIENVL